VRQRPKTLRSQQLKAMMNLLLPFTPLQANPTPQAYAIPDVTDGLRDATQFLNTLGATFLDAAACQYYLCLHYALYSTQIPNNQG
jgi:hypothetical protein